MGRPTVVIELAEDARFARDLAAGGVFVPACGLALTSECELLVRSPRGELRLDARVVYVDASRGAGLELVGFGPAIKEQLAVLAVPIEPAAPPEPPPPPPAPPEIELLTLADLDDDPSTPLADDAGATTDTADTADSVEASAEGGDVGETTASEGSEATASEGNETTASDVDAIDATDGGEDETDEAGAPARKLAKNVQERLRGLTLAQQIKYANSSDPTERMTLERLYGKNVWEALLRNQRLTAPEVSRIARMGTLPRVMLETIVNNGAWLQIPEVRRALLSNPRLGTDQIIRILRMLPKHELKLAATMTVYSYAVRDQAKRLLKTD